MHGVDTNKWQAPGLLRSALYNSGTCHLSLEDGRSHTSLVREPDMAATTSKFVIQLRGAGKQGPSQHRPAR